STGNPLDFAIEGNGMFRLQVGNTMNYTRAGNFYLDDVGTIVNADGHQLMDESNQEIIIPEDASFSISPLGEVIIINENNEPETLATIGLSIFSNPAGLTKLGGNLYAV